MFTADPQKQFDELKAKLLAQINTIFPITGPRGQYTVTVRDIAVGDPNGKSVDDIRGQLDTKLKKGTWSVPVNATLEVRAKGKVLISKRVKIASIPRMTRHYSHIYKGRDVTISHQWRLRPGAYVKETQKDGEFEAQFQLAKGRSFDIQMDPASGYMFVAMGGRKIPAYSVLKAAGISDEKMKGAWGAAFETNKKRGASGNKDMASFVHAAGIKAGETHAATMQQYFEGTKVDPDVMKSTLGSSTNQLNAGSLLTASRKLLSVSAGKEDADQIDSIKYKELWTPGDHMMERLKRSERAIIQRVHNAFKKTSVLQRLAKKDSSVMRDIVPPDLLSGPMYGVFKTDLASDASQINPVQMLSDRSNVTIMGKGGITNEHQLTFSNTAVEPSQIGYVDPVFTPEGSGTGAVTHLAAGVTVKNRQPYTKMYNMRTHRVEDVPPTVASTKIVVLPDQITWKNGKPIPNKAQVRVSNAKGKIVFSSFSKADYVLLAPTQMFSIETNMVPFLQNDSAHRSTLTARHMGQAISITGREAPLVQVEISPGKTWEKEVGGRFLAHKAPVAGTVEKVAKDHIVIRGKDKKLHTVDIYDHYPLNDAKAMLHSTPQVKVGDTVKEGQSLAESNYVKDGHLALGTNLRTAYLANGQNHEDGIVVSESAAKKMGSEHLYKPSMLTTTHHIIAKEKFRAHKGSAFTPEQYKLIGEDGTAPPGTIVHPGDPIVLALGPEHPTESGVGIIAGGNGRIGRIKGTGYSNAALTWDHDYPGEVVRVTHSGNTITAHVATKEALQVGSKISTRHSAKGVVAKILPDDEMPRGESGKQVEMLLNFTGVPGRMNPGQLLETAAGNIAEKTGKPYVIKNFDGDTDYLKKVKGDLKKHGIAESEVLYDPKTGRRLGPVTVGPHYAFQLVHQADKKTSARAGGAYIKGLLPKISYDRNGVPASGGHGGGQSLSGLGIYASVVNGMNSNLEEMQTLKSDMPQAVATWDALSRGEPLPAPKIPGVYKKLEAYMRGIGLNVDKEGNSLRIVPATDVETLALSHGEVKRPDMAISAKNVDQPEPEKGGLFDRRVFDGLSGKRWGHIRLAEAMPNPVFQKPLAALLGVKPPDLESIIEGKKTLGKFGTGPKAISAAIGAVKLAPAMAAAKKLLDDPKTVGAKLNNANQLYKSLRMLKTQGLTPANAYMMRHVPVLPPVYRPFVASPDKKDTIHSLNKLYRRLGQVNVSLQASRKAGVPYELDLKNYGDLYREVQNLTGSTAKSKMALDTTGRGTQRDKLPGIMHLIAGEKPKDGFFQGQVFNKRQDYTARSVIVADPGLKPDELGLPRKIATELFKPQVLHELERVDPRPDARVRALEKIRDRTPEAMRALERVVKDHPVLLKRDPVLHAHGLVGQRVKLVDSPATQVSPLILGPIGGDIDGDTVSILVPQSNAAKDEVRKIMPSQVRTSEATGTVLASPSGDSALGLYRATMAKKSRATVYPTLEAAEKSFNANKLDLTDAVMIGGTRTTLGRARIARIVPEKFKHQILTDLKNPVGKSVIKEILEWTARNRPLQYTEVQHGLTSAGFHMAYDMGTSITLKDLEPLRGPRNKIISAAHAQVQALKGDSSGKAATQVYLAAASKIRQAYTKHYEKNPTSLYEMSLAGVKAKGPQFQGLVMAPMVVQDQFGRPQPVPITRSFSEGVSVGDYWTQAPGARRGLIRKTKGTAVPGDFTKMLSQASIDQTITAEDCGTTHGITMAVSNRDVIDRYLASSVALSGRKIPARTVVTPALVGEFVKAKIKNVSVRSPLRCIQPHGVCAVCMGLRSNGHRYAVGQHVGLQAAQALGERAAQIMLRETHGGGILTSAEKKITDDFGVVQNLFYAGKRSALSASIAPSAGMVRKVTALPQGGWAIATTKTTHPLFSRQEPLGHMKAGYQFQKGEQLTEGDPNIHDLLATQGLGAVQRHMVSRIGGIYAREGVRQRHVEMAVRSATNMVRVTDPGDHPGVLRGDYMQKTVVDASNQKLGQLGKRLIKYQVTLKSIAETPRYRQRDWMGGMAGKNIVNTLTSSAAEGRTSNLAGFNPVPRIAVGAPRHIGTLQDVVSRRRFR